MIYFGQPCPEVDICKKPTSFKKLIYIIMVNFNLFFWLTVHWLCVHFNSKMRFEILPLTISKREIMEIKES